MHDRFKAIVLRLLKVPAEPQTPAGSPGSVKVFRAAPNFYRLNLFTWGIRQAAAFGALFVFLVVWHTSVSKQLPPRVNLIVDLLKVAGLVLLVAQLPLSYMLVRLDYEMRWYIVTDRSLRIRTGIWNVRESTLTFANIQQITVRQGPLQRLLGIYDLEVTTAGGGGGGATSHGHLRHGESMHRGFFHGIDNAPEVRAMMLERLKHLRDAGLGDPDEAHHEAVKPSPALVGLPEAARELLREVQALRQAMG
jgi:uncharacterized membrane protein YdbT with pleckstrin-like domain